MRYTEAKELAIQAHYGQVRRYTGEPYVNHPIAVAEIVSSITDDEDMIIAALLHDTVEDTDIGIDIIIARFGTRVGNLVTDVTNVSHPSHGNRAIRKSIDRNHLKQAHPDAKTIKLADLIDNTQSIAELDRNLQKFIWLKTSTLTGFKAGSPYPI